MSAAGGMPAIVLAGKPAAPQALPPAPFALPAGKWALVLCARFAFGRFFIVPLGLQGAFQSAGFTVILTVLRLTAEASTSKR